MYPEITDQKLILVDLVDTLDAPHFTKIERFLSSLNGDSWV